jgi:hypothetical protein
MSTRRRNQSTPPPAVPKPVGTRDGPQGTPLRGTQEQRPTEYDPALESGFSAFLVSAQHNGVFGWIEIQPNDVP